MGIKQQMTEMHIVIGVVLWAVVIYAWSVYMDKKKK
jgi:hypothetical protein